MVIIESYTLERIENQLTNYLYLLNIERNSPDNDEELKQHYDNEYKEVEELLESL